MKLCYLASGTSVHTQRWISYFAETGHDVHLITDTPYESDKIKVHQLGSGDNNIGYNRTRFFSLASWATRIGAMVREINPDLLHSHYVSSYGTLSVLSRFHPLVITAWGSDILVEPKKSMLLRQAVKFTLKRADAFTCDADHVIDAMAKLGADRSKISLIFFGTNTQMYSPEKKNPDAMKKLGLSDSPVVISTRKLEPIYDIESLVRAVPGVIESIPEAKFLIIGRGSLKESLVNLAGTLGVPDSITFMDEVVNSELPGYLASSDIYVSTALSDAGLAASTAEAMSCGLPVVITDFGDNKEWVEDGVSGCLVPLSSPQVLADRITYLLENRETGAEYGRKAREVIVERNNYHKQMDKVDTLYQELVKGYRK